MDTDRNYFWVSANPSMWHPDKIKGGGEIFYTAYSENRNLEAMSLETTYIQNEIEQRYKMLIVVKDESRYVVSVGTTAEAYTGDFEELADAVITFFRFE